MGILVLEIWLFCSLIAYKSYVSLNKSGLILLYFFDSMF